jgi:hypothetical protein
MSSVLSDIASYVQVSITALLLKNEALVLPVSHKYFPPYGTKNSLPCSKKPTMDPFLNYMIPVNSEVLTVMTEM